MSFFITFNSSAILSIRLESLATSYKAIPYLHLLYTQITYSPSPKVLTKAKFQGLNPDKQAAVTDMATVDKTVDTFNVVVMNSH